MQGVHRRFDLLIDLSFSFLLDDLVRCNIDTKNVDWKLQSFLFRYILNLFNFRLVFFFLQNFCPNLNPSRKLIVSLYYELPICSGTMMSFSEFLRISACHIRGAVGLWIFILRRTHLDWADLFGPALSSKEDCHQVCYCRCMTRSGRPDPLGEKMFKNLFMQGCFQEIILSWYRDIDCVARSLERS